MSKDQEPKNLENLLDRIGEFVQDKERVSLGAILEVAGHISFGPLVLAAGVALAAFGLSLISRDGLLALLAFVLTSITLGWLHTNCSDPKSFIWLES